jgi:dTDP-4-amino-4,6-dideoxygalactose transaminase
MKGGFRSVAIPFFDLKPQFVSIETEVQSAIHEVFRTQQFILGPHVEELEQTIARYCNTRYAVGVASGSDALVLSLMALGIGPGDEVILPPFTFFATGGAVSRVGATPVFVDIDPITFNIHPPHIEEKITPRTRALVPVHLYGQCADMEPILAIARPKQLFVVEDAAQAIGAEYKPRSELGGQRAGQMGDMGCFSFFPTKNLGAFGDAGMIVTDSPDWADKIRSLRIHGSQAKYLHKCIGMNSRLDTLQAAILLVKFRHLEQWTEKRRRKAQRYGDLFKDLIDSVPEIHLPSVQHENRHVYHQYVVRVPKRNELKQFLFQEGIGTEIYYPVPLHLQECYSFLGYRRGDLPQSERASEETLALPIYPELTDLQQEFVVDRIKAFYKRSIR